MKQTTIGGNKRKAANMLAMAGLVIVFIAYMFPFLMVVINSLKQKRDIIKSPFSWLYTIKGLSFDNFVKAFTQMDYLNAFKNSLIVTVSATVLVTLLAAMLAYYIVRHNNKISKITFALMVASMIIPFQAIMIPLVSIYGGTLNILNHRLTLIFMHTGFSMAMSVFMFHGFIKGNVPIALEEAAYIDGCTHSQTFFRIVLPLLKPIISTMVILNSLAFWNDFLLPSLVLTDKKLLTLPLSTYSFYGTYSADYGTIMAGLLLCVIPILILYVVLQKQITNCLKSVDHDSTIRGRCLSDRNCFFDIVVHKKSFLQCVVLYHSKIPPRFNTKRDSALNKGDTIIISVLQKQNVKHFDNPKYCFLVA